MRACTACRDLAHPGPATDDPCEHGEFERLWGVPFKLYPESKEQARKRWNKRG